MLKMTKKQLDPIKLPIGKSDFKKLIKGGYHFVDKTLFIKEAIKNISETSLITRPRRFGKTLALSMMYYFLEMGILEKNHENLFDNFEISQDKAFCQAYQNKFPVIFITFKSIESPTYEGAIKRIQSLISKLYTNFQPFLYEDLTVAARKQYDLFLEETADSEKLKNALSDLMQLLNNKTGQDVVVLIDEYDTPVISAYQNSYYKDMIDLMKGMLGEVLKDNKNLQFGLLTGITRVAKEGLFSGLNNIRIYSILDELYSQYFGFTEREVSTLIKKCNASVSENKIKDWYNGYQFGSHTIYNPWSILSCLATAGNPLEPYWLNTASNALVKNLIKTSTTDIKKVFGQLLQKETINEQVDKYLLFSDLQRDSSAIWNLLLNAGYLKSAKMTLVEGDYYCDLSIPNSEVMMIYKQIVESWFCDGELGIKTYQAFMGALVDVSDHEKTQFSELLNQYLLDSGSVFDFTNKVEQVFHTFMLGIVNGLRDKYRILSNRESGFGRFDLALIPHSRGTPGHILELKVADREDKLVETAELALQQIEEKCYVTDVKQRGVKQIQLLGIAFYAKRAMVKCKIISVF